MFWRVLIFTFCIFNCSIVFALDLNQDEYNIVNGVIYPEQIAILIVNQCSRGSIPEPYWTPTKSQVLIMDEKLKGYITLNSIELRGKYDDYYKQFTGVVVDGKKAIYVNAFEKKFWEKTKNYMLQYKEGTDKRKRELFKDYLDSKSLPKNFINWRWNPVNTCHGGESFFGAIYFLENNNIKYFRFNH